MKISYSIFQLSKAKIRTDLVLFCIVELLLEDVEDVGDDVVGTLVLLDDTPLLVLNVHPG